MGNKNSSGNSKDVDPNEEKCKRDKKVPRIVRIKKCYEKLIWLDMSYFFLLIMFILLMFLYTKIDTDDFGIYMRFRYAILWNIMALGLIGLGITRIVFGCQQFYILTVDEKSQPSTVWYLCGTFILLLSILLAGLIIFMHTRQPQRLDTPFKDLTESIYERWPQARNIVGKPKSEEIVYLEQQPKNEGEKNLSQNENLKRLGIIIMLTSVTIMTLTTIP